MSASRITIADDDRLPNIHPGEILREDFLIGSAIPVSEVSAGCGISPARLESLLAERIPVDAEIALRLSRYFNMSETFFLGLQNDYDLEQVERAEGDALDRIVPRAN